MIASNELLSTSNKSKTDYICGFYLRNLCSNGERCELIHPLYQLPYCWYYQYAGEEEVLVCPKDITENIEKQYCDVAKDS